MFSAYVVVGEPPTEVATTVATPSAAIARPSTGSRSRLVIAATALTCPAFSAMRAMIAGSTSSEKFTEKLGAVKVGRPNQSALLTAAKLIRSWGNAVATQYGPPVQAAPFASSWF